MPKLTPFPRRHTLSRLLAMLAVAAFGSLRSAGAQTRAPLEATPRDAEGPFYPTRVPPEADADLTRVAGRTAPAKGTPLDISGRVVGTDGKPIAGAKVELWQCDALGRYHHVDGDPGTLDENFQGYGVLTTDADGGYAFRTIRPVPYGQRPPHLHFKLAHARAQPLTTQLYPRGESAERGRGFGLSGPDTRRRLEFVMSAGKEAGSLATTYDFVLTTA